MVPGAQIPFRDINISINIAKIFYHQLATVA